MLEHRTLLSPTTNLMAGGCSLSLKSLRELKMAHETGLLLQLSFLPFAFQL